MDAPPIDLLRSFGICFETQWRDKDWRLSDSVTVEIIVADNLGSWKYFRNVEYRIDNLF